MPTGPQPFESPPSKRLDGDEFFDGVSQILSPGTLPPGLVADARNSRFRFRRAVPRLGVSKLPWTNRVSAGASSAPVPFGTIYGAGEFRDADDNLWAIVAADGVVYRTRDGAGAVPLALPAGVSITGPVSFTQTRNGLLMFRGRTAPVLRLVTLDAGFASIVADSNDAGTAVENPSDGTQPIPNADRGEWIGGRLFVPYETATEKDLVAISDFNNATRYASVRSQARINQGSSDRLLRVYRFGKSNAAVCFKSASVYALYNLNGDLTEMLQDEVTKEVGLASSRACLNVGKDEEDAPDEVWFLAERKGLCRLAFDRDGRIGIGQLPVSLEVQKIFDRIDWQSARTTATAALWDNKFYLALPIDGGRHHGPDLVRGASYSGGLSIKVVIPGERYTWTKGANDTSITDGITTWTESTELVAGSFVLTMAGGPGLVTARLTHTYAGVNNCVVVFDFLRGRWCGLDQGSALSVVEWVKLRFDGETRLFFLGRDGFINLYESLYCDEVGYEVLSLDASNNVFNGLSYDSTGRLEVPAQLGTVYFYQIPAGEVVVNGSESYTTAQGSFRAASTVLVATGPPSTLAVARAFPVNWSIAQEDIDHEILTRGYQAVTLRRKRSTWARLSLATWFPSYSISEVTEGANEETARVSARTKSRTDYDRPYDREPWNQTNLNDDHATRHRQDYALVLSDSVTPSGQIVSGVRYYVESTDVESACSITYNAVTYNNGQTFLGVAGQTTYSVGSGTPVVYPPGSYAFLGQNGIDPDLHQEWTEDIRLASRGREVQLRLRNTQGRAELVSIELESHATDGRRGKRT